MPKLTALQGGCDSRICVKCREASPPQPPYAGLVGLNPGHEMHIVQMLCVYYGWRFGVDLELLPPKSFHATDEGISA